MATVPLPPLLSNRVFGDEYVNITTFPSAAEMAAFSMELHSRWMPGDFHDHHRVEIRRQALPVNSPTLSYSLVMRDAPAYDGAELELIWNSAVLHVSGHATHRFSMNVLMEMPTFTIDQSLALLRPLMESRMAPEIDRLRAAHRPITRMSRESLAPVVTDELMDAPLTAVEFNVLVDIARNCLRQVAEFLAIPPIRIRMVPPLVRFYDSPLQWAEFEVCTVPTLTPQAILKAEDLLVRCLSNSQREEYLASKQFTVVDPRDGKEYLVTTRNTNNVEDKASGDMYCVQLVEHAPVGDFMLAVKLLIENDPVRYFKTANRTPKNQVDAIRRAHAAMFRPFDEEFLRLAARAGPPCAPSPGISRNDSG